MFLFNGLVFRLTLYLLKAPRQFIAIIFLAYAGIVDIRQERQDIMAMKYVVYEGISRQGMPRSDFSKTGGL